MTDWCLGRQGIEVFLPVLRPLYTPRTHLFLYDPRMYNNPEPVEQEPEAEAAPAAEEPGA